MTRYLTIFGLCLAAAFAQSTVQAPQAGCLLGTDGALRPVQGIAGAFLAGVPATTGVVSSACSSSLALVKTDTAIEVRDGSLRLLARWTAPAGPALIALPPSGQAGFVYFIATGELATVNAQSPPHAVPQPFGGNVLAIASPDPQHVLAVVAQSGGPQLVRITAADGAVETVALLDGVPTRPPAKSALLAGRRRAPSSPLALLPDGTLVFADGPDVVIRRGGADQRQTLPAAVVSITQMASSWLALRLADGSAPVALRLNAGGGQTCRVPTSEPAP